MSLLTALVFALLIVGASPVLADPARPTNYRSEIIAVDPVPNGVNVEIVGGDAFVQVVVTEGHSVVIPGYFDEPYLRIDEDLRVWVNEASPAYYINRDRYGETDIPEGVDADDAPRWRLVGDDGRFAWHDHRTHWMSKDRPPTVEGGFEQTVFPWELPVVIDDVEVIVSGELVWLPSENPFGAVLAGVLGLLPVAILGYRSPAAKTVMLGLGSVVAFAVATAQAQATPPADRGFPLGVLLSVLALGCAIAGALMLRSKMRAARWVVFIGALSLVGWVIMTMGSLWMPVLPSALAPPLERGGVALAAWSGLGVAFLSARSIVGRYEVDQRGAEQIAAAAMAR